MIDKNLVKGVAIISSISWIMVTSSFIGFGIGYYLDKFLKTSPLFIIIFFILGIIAGCYESFKILIKAINQKKGG